MAKAGRKRKAGSRYKCGKLKAAMTPYDRGSEWVQERKARFGEHYSSALGRAYASGLLGTGDEAKRLYDAGRKFARVYNRVIGPVVYRCALNDSPRGRTLAAIDDPEQIERDRYDQAWLYAAMDSLDVDGSRPWLDQLIHVNYTDSGPHWLDGLLVVRWHKHGGYWRAGEPEGDPVDCMLLDAAIRALDIIAPEKRARRILAA